jgi:hypothetical protein
VQLNRKWLAVLAALVVVNIALAGMLYIRLTASAPDPLAPRSGFKQSMLHVPLFPTEDPNTWEEAPNTGFGAPSGYSMQASWASDKVYAGWGGDVRYWLKNTGPNDLFIYGIAFEGDWGPSVCATVGVTILPGQKKYLGMLHFPGPDVAGTYNFTFKTGLFAESTRVNENGSPNGWWDYGYVSNGMKPIAFRPLAQPHRFKERTNPAYYFDKANRLMNSKDAAVLQKADEILARIPGQFSIYQAAAAFDFVHTNITYKAEPAGQDHWQSPAETLELMTGDCEDYTLLLAAMMTAMGGTTRFHVETDHAFLSVLVGTDLQGATDALGRFYNTDLRVASIGDRSGNWITADATDSDYLGALPLGGEPLAAGGWGLTNTTVHYPCDMLPD